MLVNEAEIKFSFVLLGFSEKSILLMSGQFYFGQKKRQGTVREFCFDDRVGTLTFVVDCLDN